MIFLTFSCAGIAEIAEKESNAGAQKGALVLYFYQPVLNPLDISFVIKNVEIKKQNGEWTSLSRQPVSIRSTDIQGNQVLLAESQLEEGDYEKIRMEVLNPIFSREQKEFNLTMPQQDNKVELNIAVSIRANISAALFLNWFPNKSIASENDFRPLITVERQKLSPPNVLLYVTNRGSNYVSVIDRFENRVVAVIGVEQNPTGIALSPEQDRLFVLNSGSNSISIIDTSQDFARDRIQLISGIQPIEMALIPSLDDRNGGKLYISNQGSNDVSVVDISRKAQIKSISVGNKPLGIVANPERQEIYVVNSGSNSISIIDSQTDTVKNIIDVDTNPLDAVVVNDFLYVLNGGVNRITLINLILGKIDGSINVSSNLRNALFSKQFNRVYLTHYDTSQISFLIPSSRIITRTIDADIKPMELAIDETRNSLYVAGHNSNKIAVIDPISEMVEKIITVGKNPYGIAFIK